MNARRLTIALVSSLALAGTAFAGDAPTTAPAATPTTHPATPAATTTAAVTHVTGPVKAWNAQTKQLTVTVAGKDAIYSTGSLTLDPAVKVGATVDVTLTGSKVTAVAVHKA